VQNGMVDRGIRTLKEQCAHRLRFGSLQHDGRVIGNRTSFHNHHRQRQSRCIDAPAATFALAAGI